MITRTWLEEEERVPDTRPPPAFKVPAEPGWRLVWMLVRERRSEVRSLHCEVALGVMPITFWGFEAPRVIPGLPGLAPESTLGQPVVMLPLHGVDGYRLVARARIFTIAGPTDARTDAELVAACSEHLAMAQRNV